MKHTIALTKTRLTVSRDREIGVAEVRVGDNVIEGTLSYSKPLEGKSRAVRLELIVLRGGVRYRTTIARLKQPGSMEFRWSLGPEEDTYILLTDQINMSPETFIKRLGMNSAFAGAAWRGVTEAKLRLVLDIPFAVDVVDEAEVIVRPKA